MEKHFDNKQVDIFEQAAADAVEQYEIVNLSGKHAERCLHARIVAAAYLKADNDAEYQQWKLIGQNECRQ